MGQFKSLKLTFCKFKAQFELECQGHQFLKYNQKPLYDHYTQLRFEAEIPNGLKGVAFTRHYTKFLSFKANQTLKVKINVTSFQTHLRYLDDY